VVAHGSLSQSVISTLSEGVENPDTGELETLMNAPTMFKAAQRIGSAIRTINATEGKALQAEDINFDVSFLFGGQINGRRMRLFMVYPAGNFIECDAATRLICRSASTNTASRCWTARRAFTWTCATH